MDEGLRCVGRLGVGPDPRGEDRHTCTVAARVTSVLGLVSVAKSGAAVVPIPIALGGAEPELVRLFELVPELTRSWRILAHRDRRRTRAAAAFFDFIAVGISALRPILTG
jgi:DNA-binding transcriptional LysR family regulator